MFSIIVGTIVWILAILVAVGVVTMTMILLGVVALLILSNQAYERGERRLSEKK